MGRLKYIIFITAVFAAVLLSGCVGEQKVTPTPTPPPTPQVIVTPVVTSAPGITPTGNKVLVKLDTRRGFTPKAQTISAGDEIIWENTDSETLTLVSGDGFFDPELLAYGKQYSYIFNKLGTYNFYLEKNKNLSGTIIVEVQAATPAPTPAVPTVKELSPNAIFVDARMTTPAYWAPGNYSLDALQVQIYNQQAAPLIINAQIVSGGQILEEKSFSLDTEGSSYQFANQKRHFISSTNVTLRLLIQGYQPAEYPFKIVSNL